MRQIVEIVKEHGSTPFCQIKVWFMLKRQGKLWILLGGRGCDDRANGATPGFVAT